ncbi:hypothetical protein ACWEKT_29285 [Nocardia takedensis]
MTSSVTIDSAALHACHTVRAGGAGGYLVFRLSEQRHIEIDHTLCGLDYAQLLCGLPDSRCRWVLHTDRARVITWLPEQATIMERLLYTAALTDLRAHLPDTTLTAHAEDRSELARLALPPTPPGDRARPE